MKIKRPNSEPLTSIGFDDVRLNFVLERYRRRRASWVQAARQDWYSFGLKRDLLSLLVDIAPSDHSTSAINACKGLDTDSGNALSE